MSWVCAGPRPGTQDELQRASGYLVARGKLRADCMVHASILNIVISQSFMLMKRS